MEDETYIEDGNKIKFKVKNCNQFMNGLDVSWKWKITRNTKKKQKFMEII